MDTEAIRRRRRYQTRLRLSIPPDRFWMDASNLWSPTDGGVFQRSLNLAGTRDQVFGFNTVADSRRPLYRLNATPNGMPGIDYDGSNDYSFLYQSHLSGFDAVPDNYFNTSGEYPQTVLAVVTVDTLTDANILGQGSSSNGFFNLWHSGLGIRSNGKVRAAITANGGAICEGGTVATGSPQLLGAVLQSGSMASRLNRVEVATSASTGTPHSYTWSTIGGTDGNDSTGATDACLNGKVHEILHYGRRLSSLELAEAEHYLYLKWQA